MTGSLKIANEIKVNKIVIGNFRQSDFRSIRRIKARMQWIERKMGNREVSLLLFQNFVVKVKNTTEWLEFGGGGIEGCLGEGWLVTFFINLKEHGRVYHIGWSNNEWGKKKRFPKGSGAQQDGPALDGRRRPATSAGEENECAIESAEVPAPCLPCPLSQAPPRLRATGETYWTQGVMLSGSCCYKTFYWSRVWGLDSGHISMLIF